MKLIITFFAVVLTTTLFAQERVKDEELLVRVINSRLEDDKKYSGFIYAFYKNHVSRQILNDCIYDHSCSKFSHDVFENFGLIKGLFLTADRLTRCNRASLAELPPSRINMNGSAIDHWNFYANKD